MLIVLLCDLQQVFYPLWAARHENDEHVNITQVQADAEDPWQPAGWSVAMLCSLIPDTCPAWAQEGPPGLALSH